MHYLCKVVYCAQITYKLGGITYVIRKFESLSTNFLSCNNLATHLIEYYQKINSFLLKATYPNS